MFPSLFADDFPQLDNAKVGGIQISLSDMGLPSWEHHLEADLIIIKALLKQRQPLSLPAKAGEPLQRTAIQPQSGVQ